MSKQPSKSKFSISKGLEVVDIFEDQVRFNVDGAESLKSSIGGVLSLAIIIFLLVESIIQTVSVFDREDPTIVQTREIEDDPLLISLNKTTNFIFAVGITKNNANVNLTEGTAVSFASTYSHQTRAVNGTISKQKGRIMWAPCEPANFSTNVFPDETYTAYSLKYAYCPTMINYTNVNNGLCPDNIQADYPNCVTPFEFALQGNYLSFNFRYLQVALHSCANEDAATIQGLVCSPDTSTAFASSEFKVNLYYANTLINPVDYETPNRSYIDTMYWSVNPSVYKLADIYVDAVTVQDYDDYFSMSYNHNRSYFSLNIDTMRETQVFEREDFLEINLRRSNSNAITIRKYAKLLDVVSSIGGISKVLLVVGAIIALGYSRFRHQTIISNKLYDFPQKKEKNNRDPRGSGGSQKRGDSSKRYELQPQKKKTNSTGATGRTGAGLQGNKGGNSNTSDDMTNDSSILGSKEKRLLAFDGITYLKDLWRTIVRRKNPEAELGEKARAQVTKDLDIIKMVEKLKEIDKLKMILLTRHQREAFDFIEKPLITLNNDKPVHRESLQILEIPGDSEGKGIIKTRESDSSRKGENGAVMSKYARLYMAYTLLKADNDPRNWKHNKKIMCMINEDVMDVFRKVDEHFGDKPDPKRFDEVVRKIGRNGAGGEDGALSERGRIELSVV